MLISSRRKATCSTKRKPTRSHTASSSAVSRLPTGDSEEFKMEEELVGELGKRPTRRRAILCRTATMAVLVNVNTVVIRNTTVTVISTCNGVRGWRKFKFKFKSSTEKY